MAMQRNALMPMELGPAADVGNFTNPLMQGLQTYRQGMQSQFEGDRALASERMNQRKLGMQIDEHEYTKRKRTIEDVGNIATAADAEQDPAKRAQIYQVALSHHPDFNSLPPMYRDPAIGPRLLMAEAGKAKNKLDDDYKQSQIGLNKAHTNFYNSRATALTAPQPAAPQAAPVADPLQGAGLDDEGNIVTSGQRPASPYAEPTGETWQIAPQQGKTPQRMNLGGPRDDIDRSMRLDEGRPQGPAGVRMAQAAPAPWRPEPSQTDQAAARMFGPTGVTSPEVPGIVTDAGRNRRVDVPATREAQGQRAYDKATPEQQQRLMRLRQDQQLWSAALGTPRAGYYYGPDGRELPKTDRNYKGDKETQAQVLMNMQKIDQATKKLLEPGIAGAVTPGGVGDYFTRSIAGQANVGETGQSFADLKQAALGIAYALSGKQVAVAEMKNFIDSYGPQPWDTEWRIKAKSARMKEFYGALLSAVRGGEDYDKAFSRAMATMGVKNPDGTSVGGPAGSDAGKPPAPDLSKVPTDELLRRLQGGR